MRARLVEAVQCEFHKDDSNLKTFLSEEGWTKMQRHLKEAGLGQFAQKLTELAWEVTPGSEGKVECLPF